MNTQSIQAPLSQVLSQLGRALAGPHDRSSPTDDPIFLPDAFSLTPDQAQEMRYGKGRDQ